MLVLSVDLGKLGDYTAIALLETRPDAFHIRHVQRLPLGMDYVTVVGTVAKIMTYIRDHEQGEPVLVLDGTGVGVAVTDIFVRCGMCPVVVTITGGQHVTTDMGSGGYHVPKQDLIAGLAIVMQAGTLKVSPLIPDAETLLTELQTFKFRVTGSGNASFNAEGKDHDDLLMAVAMAVWYATQFNTGGSNARFSPEVVDRCAMAGTPVIDYRNEYTMCVISSWKKDTIFAAAGHAAGGGSVIIDEAKHLEIPAELNGRQSWQTILKEVLALRFRYRAETILVSSDVKTAIENNLQDFDYLLCEIPATSADRTKAFDGLETLLQQNLIRVPQNDRLLREIRGWFTVYHADRRIAGEVGVEGISALADRLSNTSYISWGPEDRRGPGEWPENRSNREDLCFLLPGAVH